MTKMRIAYIKFDPTRQFGEEMFDISYDSLDDWLVENYLAERIAEFHRCPKRNYERKG